MQDLLINGGMYFAGVTMLGLYIRSIKEDFNKQVCKLEDADKEIKEVVYHHGHKGLDSNGSKVTSS